MAGNSQKGNINLTCIKEKNNEAGNYKMEVSCFCWREEKLVMLELYNESVWDPCTFVLSLVEHPWGPQLKFTLDPAKVNLNDPESIFNAWYAIYNKVLGSIKQDGYLPRIFCVEIEINMWNFLKSKSFKPYNENINKIIFE